MLSQRTCRAIKAARSQARLRNRLPLPHRHKSRRPNFSTSSLSPLTMRTPHLTFHSEGEPATTFTHGLKNDTSSLWHRMADLLSKRDKDQLRPRQDLNLTFNLRRVACKSDTPQGRKYPVEESNPFLDVRSVACEPAHSPGIDQVASDRAEGFEPPSGCLQNSCIAALPRRIDSRPARS